MRIEVGPALLPSVVGGGTQAGMQDRPRGTVRHMVDSQGETSARTILDVLNDLEARGYTSQFRPLPKRRVQCVVCGLDSPADETVLRELRRLEGASDPADMLAVVGLACPHCGARGTAVLGYGPEADPLDADVLSSLEDCRRGC